MEAADGAVADNGTCDGKPNSIVVQANQHLLAAVMTACYWHPMKQAIQLTHWQTHQTFFAAEHTACFEGELVVLTHATSLAVIAE